MEFSSPEPPFRSYVPKILEKRGETLMMVCFSFTLQRPDFIKKKIGLQESLFREGHAE